MKYLIPALLILMLAISGCEQPIDAQDTDDTRDITNESPVDELQELPDLPEETTPTDEVVEEPVFDTPPEPEVPVEEPKVEEPVATQPKEETPTSPWTDKELAVLSRSKEKIKSYEFTYAPPPENLARDKFMVRGNKIKLVLFDRGWFNPQTHMTAIYLDMDKKTAVGVCDDPRTTHCPNPDKRFDLEYSEYIIKMPLDWLAEIKKGTMTEGEKVDDRLTKKFTYAVGDQTYIQWVDEYSGIPLRIKILEEDQDDILIDFRDAAFNSVSEDAFPKEFFS